MARRIRGPYMALGRLDARLYDAQERLAALEETVAATHQFLTDEMHPLLRALVAEESENRRRLSRLRADPDYERAWSEARPLVSVVIPTRERAHLLSTRSLPSILGQSYGELEVIVVGDVADEATEDAIRELDDRRLSYRNLPIRLDISDDPERRWMVATTLPRNEGNRLARGRWIVEFDDDDAMRENCIELLIERAREDRSEVAYGRVLVRQEDGPLFEIGKFPPELAAFSWAAGMYHAGLRFFQREFFAADLGLPGDWFLAERMLRAGVRFGMVDAALGDVWPSKVNQPPPPQ